MRTTLLAGLVIVLVLLSACGTSGAPGELVTEADDVLGVWRRTKAYSLPGIGMVIRNMHIKLEADGTMGFSRVPDKWDYELCSEEFTFQGNQLKVTETSCPGFNFEDERWPDFSCAGLGELSGVYEVQLLANGNLKFIDAGDKCQTRTELLTLAEWEPVP